MKKLIASALCLSTIISCSRKVGSTDSTVDSNPVPPEHTPVLVCTKKDQSVDINRSIIRKNITVPSDFYDQLLVDLKTLGLKDDVYWAAASANAIPYPTFQFQGAECNVQGKFVCSLKQNSFFYEIKILNPYAFHASSYVRQMTMIVGIADLLAQEGLEIKKSLADKIDEFKKVDISKIVSDKELSKEELYEIVYGLNNESDEVCEYK